jgi:hypothetical protein
MLLKVFENSSTPINAALSTHFEANASAYPSSQIIEKVRSFLIVTLFPALVSR